MKQGWFGYDFSEKAEIQVGLQQVPFGIQTYNSHNWFFNITYYLRFEDDHDMGSFVVQPRYQKGMATVMRVTFITSISHKKIRGTLKLK